MPRFASLLALLLAFVLPALSGCSGEEGDDDDTVADDDDATGDDDDATGDDDDATGDDDDATPGDDDDTVGDDDDDDTVGDDDDTVATDADGDGWDETVDCDDNDASLNLDDIDADGVDTCSGDCDDTNAEVYPGAEEACNGVDDDCNGTPAADEIDADVDGFMVCENDCDDANADVNPDATEVCDGFDTDCDTLLPADEIDFDGDGYLPCADDCDDEDIDVNPAATEVCNGYDDDCDGALFAGEEDVDGDTYLVCDDGSGVTDCDDTSADINPGAAELCDGLDTDCNGLVPQDEVDDDGDGFHACAGLPLGDDCDDADPAVNPGAAELPGNLWDEDCDGVADGMNWVSIIGTDDPAGDHDSAPVDLRNVEYLFDGTELTFRVTSWIAYDEYDAGLTMGLWITDDVDEYAFFVDNENPSLNPLQLWTSLNDWAAEMPTLNSLYIDLDTTTTSIFSFDLAELGWFDLTDLSAGAGVDLYRAAGLADVAPDWGYTAMIPAPNVVIDHREIDDSVYGDGDGVFEADEIASVDVILANHGALPTGTNLIATAVLGAGTTAPVTLIDDTSTFSGGAALDPADLATVDDSFLLQLDPTVAVGSVIELEIEITDADGNVWDVVEEIIAAYPAVVASTEILTDGNDFAAPFDIASVSYSTTNTTLTVMVESHSNHNANQEVNVLLDTDLDGSADILLSTNNVDTGDFDGGLYWWDDFAGAWEMWAVPDPFQFNAGWDFVMYGVELEDLGNPMVMYAYAAAYNAAYTDVDDAPDTIQYFSDFGVIGLSDTPFFIFEDGDVDEVSGNGDYTIDPGETWSVDISVTNAGVADSLVTEGTLVSYDPEIILTEDVSDFGTMLSGDTASGAPSFEFVVAPWAASGFYDLGLLMDGDGYTHEISLSIGI